MEVDVFFGKKKKNKPIHYNNNARATIMSLYLEEFIRILLVSCVNSTYGHHTYTYKSWDKEKIHFLFFAIPTRSKSSFIHNVDGYTHDLFTVAHNFIVTMLRI